MGGGEAASWETADTSIRFSRSCCTPEGTPGCELLRFSGIITEEDAQAMSQAIEEGCEQVDTDEW
ncbi:MAG TPA: hypothetical protein GX520_03215 [Syntrophaceticus sp.]|jgi:hypothetical protein|uniref:Uncharacterized protein n=1 Tax=Syntrophaceticus schinkii TaxID=499207 RepID=A0A0B7MLX3_9FIRM|nr:hypothetical protein [Syntrophaceticus schinkii]CEO88677.1 hypothetical protein SSCH_2390001 [Syntrophaceticus schinkii]HHY29684.1 hypothetical protein [Syntrophaceticus sp.]